MGDAGWWWIVFAAALAGVYFWYAILIARRNKVNEAMSSVDVHLNQRHDLIPNIVKLADRFMQHERELLTEVTRLREEARRPTSTPGELGKRFEVESELGRRVGQLLVRMEAYPQLKSDRPLVEAQQTWTEIEAQITAARRFYNAAVNQLNNAIQIFPGPIIASIAGVQTMPFFEAPAAARVAPSVDGIPRTPFVTPAGRVDTAFLERRRRLALRFSAVALLMVVVCFPLGMAIGGSETSDSIAGAFIWASIIGAVAAPWIVRAWQGFMRRRMIAAAVANRPDIRHIDGENDRSGSAAALSSEAFTLSTFRDSGLVGAFQSAGVQHVLTGDAQGVPFAIAEIALLDAKGYRMFGGVLASFRLAAPRPGLTIVARDQGILGNLLARAGSGIEQLPLEDPDFEGVFEVYGDDQVGGRVVLTTTMLERLKALDELAHARGFACAFLGDHLLIAFSGMNWRCPPWRILQPVGTWLHGYAEWLTGLVELPREVVKTLNLVAPTAATAPLVPTPRSAIPIDSGSGEVFSSRLWRIVGEGGMSLIYVASGAVFGGVALIGASYGVTQGYSNELFWYFWGLITAGLAYGAYAIALGVRQLAQLAWRWNAPLRTLHRR